MTIIIAILAFNIGFISGCAWKFINSKGGDSIASETLSPECPEAHIRD